MPDAHASPPKIIAVAGAGSDSGKTDLVCSLIQGFVASGLEVGALKVATATPDHRCARTGQACGCLRFDGRMRLLTDETYVNRRGKDTWKMLRAGARPVWWLQTTADVADESAREALCELRGPGLWIVEGGNFIREGLADVAIAVAPARGRNPKRGFGALVERCDALLFSQRPGEPVIDAYERARELGVGRPTFTGAFALGRGVPPALAAFVTERLASATA